MLLKKPILYGYLQQMIKQTGKTMERIRTVIPRDCGSQWGWAGRKG